MSASVSHTIKHRKNPKDVFYTPPAVAKTHIAMINGQKDDVWFDPFYGTGIYFQNFPVPDIRKCYTEIALGKDFFMYAADKIDVICSNPPYSMLDEVLARSVAFQPRVISYLLLHGAMTPKRMEFMKKAGYGLTSIYTTKVFKWYGFAEAYTFEKGASWDTCKIVFDRIVHRLEDDKPKIETAAEKRS